MEIMKKILLAIVFVITAPVMAADHTVEMLSSSNGEMMVFKPAVLKIAPWRYSNLESYKPWTQHCIYC